MPRLVLQPAAGEYALCRLLPAEPAPAWAGSSPFCSITRTPEELSVICRADVVPPGVRASRGWRLIQLVGPFDLAAVGILASIVGPLARAGISCVAAGTFDTDYLLVKADHLDAARRVLAAGGHEFKDRTRGRGRLAGRAQPLSRGHCHRARDLRNRPAADV